MSEPGAVVPPASRSAANADADGGLARHQRAHLAGRWASAGHLARERRLHVSPAWFEQALSLGWTRDPFDRLIVAHALLRRWRLATADSRLIEHLEPSRLLVL